MRVMNLAALVAFGAAASAQASTMTLQFVNVSPGASVSYSYNGGGWTSTSAGQFNWINQNGGASVQTFCTQLNEYISGGQIVTYDVKDVANVPDGGSPSMPGPMGSVKATLLKDHYARHYQGLLGSGNVNLIAAFQVVVWEITHEALAQGADANTFLSTLDLDVGAFKAAAGDASISGTIANLAESMLADLGGVSDSDFLDFAGLRGLSNLSAQDQLVVVPIPAPALLAAVGLVGAVAVRSRIR